MMATSQGAMAPNDYRTQLATTGSVDGLGYASYLLKGNTGQINANGTYWGNDTNGGAYGANMAMVVSDGKGTLYFYHPNYNNPNPQQALISSLGLTNQELQNLADRINSSRTTKNLPLVSAPAIAGWVLIVIGVAILAATFIIPPLGLAADAAAESLFYGGSWGMGLVFMIFLGDTAAAVGAAATGLYVLGGVLVLAGVASALFYPQTSNPSGQPGCFATTTILGQTNTCCNTAGACVTTNTTPNPLQPIGTGLLWVAAGAAAIIGVGVVGYVAWKHVSKPKTSTGYGYGSGTGSQGERAGSAIRRGVIWTGQQAKGLGRGLVGHPSATASNPYRRYIDTVPTYVIGSDGDLHVTYTPTRRVWRQP